MATQNLPPLSPPTFPQKHICTPESCPPTGGYYVSCVDYDRYWLMAGPYQTHAEALADKDKVYTIAEETDPRSIWKAWGTCRVKEGELKPGVLNKFNLMGVGRG